MMHVITAKRNFALVERWRWAADRLAAAVPLDIVLLAARFAVGVVFFRSGLLKTDNWQITLALFRDEYQVPLLAPELAAPLATACELAMPALLFAGLLTRLATLPLFGMIAVIQIFVYPEAWPEHLLWATLLLLVLTRGPGALSVDRLSGLEPGYGTSR